MKKLTALFLALLFCAALLPAPAHADGLSAEFDLSCGGVHDIAAAYGDVIEVAFTITRKDAAASLYINAFQNYIIYDEDFFEFVDAECFRPSGTAHLVSAIARNKIYMTDMMDTLSASAVFGTFRMRVIARSGTGRIQNAEVKVRGRGGAVVTVACQDLTVTAVPALTAEMTAVTSGQAAAVLTNDTAEPKHITGILAVYDAAGRMLGASVRTITLTGGESVALSVSAAGIDTARVFRLDGDTGAALYDCLSVRLAPDP